MMTEFVLTFIYFEETQNKHAEVHITAFKQTMIFFLLQLMF